MLQQFLLWALLGLFTAFIGLNIAHDAVHGSLSKYKSVNKVLGYSFNIIGGNCYVWNITHNIVHHTYTNIEGHDEDIALIRFTPNVATPEAAKSAPLPALVCFLFLQLVIFIVGVRKRLH